MAKTKLDQKLLNLGFSGLVSIDSLVAEIESLDESKLEVTDLGLTLLNNYISQLDDLCSRLEDIRDNVWKTQ